MSESNKRRASLEMDSEDLTCAVCLGKKNQNLLIEIVEMVWLSDPFQNCLSHL